MGELLTPERLEEIRDWAADWPDEYVVHDLLGHIEALEGILREVQRMMDDVYEKRRSFSNEQRILYRINYVLKIPQKPHKAVDDG